jgi:RNA polymerase sigma factor (sigma-70 family)
MEGMCSTTSLVSIKMNDQLIIQGLKQNSNAAYSQLYTSYYKLIESFVLHNSGTEDDAKDIFQETILILRNKAENDKLVLTSALKTYLFSISRNLWLKELRTKRKLNGNLVEETDESAEEKIINQETKQHLLQKLGRALYKMTGHCKTLLISMFVKNKSMAVVAKESGYKNMHTAQNQKYKCLEQARKEFKK